MNTNINYAKADTQSLGYAAARAGDTIGDIASELLRRFPNGWDDETAAQLKSGMQGRKHELVGERYYTRDGSNLNRVDKAPKDGNGITLSVAYACSMTPHEFGKFKSADPALYAELAKLRTEASKYVSNAYNSLKRSFDALVSGKGRTRSENKAFAEWIAGIEETSKARNKNARSKGDPSSVEDSVLMRKWAAFHAAK